MSWTTPDDVIGAWIGPDAPTDQELVQTWIDRAEREIRFRVPGIEQRIADNPDLQAVAVDVTAAMVTRVFRNPEGIRQRNTTATTGPFTDTGSVTYGGDMPGGLGLTDDELAKLAGRRYRAFTVDLGARAAAPPPEVWR